MSKKLFTQDEQVKSQEFSEKTTNKSIKLRRNIFKILFKGLEFLLMVIQLVQYIKQFFR